MNNKNKLIFDTYILEYSPIGNRFYLSSQFKIIDEEGEQVGNKRMTISHIPFDEAEIIRKYITFFSDSIKLSHKITSDEDFEDCLIKLEYDGK